MADREVFDSISVFAAMRRGGEHFLNRVSGQARSNRRRTMNRLINAQLVNSQCAFFSSPL